MSGISGLNRWPVLDYLRSVVTKAIVDPIRDGRPRDGGWPAGLRPVVIIVLGLSGVAAGMAILSPLFRSRWPMVMIEGAGSAIPRPTVWVLLLITVVLITVFQAAALHGPWWLRILATLASTATMIIWGFAGVVGATGLRRWVVALPILLVAGLILFVAIRARGSFRWWEFPALLAIIVGGVVIAPLLIGSFGTALALGYDEVPLLTVQTLQSMATLAIPVLIAAGLSVAEVTVSLTVWAGRLGSRVGERRARRQWAFVISAVVLVLRLIQTGYQLLHWDRVADGWPVIFTSVVVALLLVVVTAGLFRLAGSSGPPRADELPEAANRVALPIGVAITALVVAATAVVVVVQFLSVLSPHPFLRSLRSVLSNDALSYVTRVLLGLTLLIISVRQARRGRLDSALVIGTTGVLLLAVAARFLTGGRLPVGLNPDVLNLLATVMIMVVGLRLLLLRRLTSQRVIALSTALVLSSLFSARDFVSDPIGAVIGVSGVALVVFGLIWDLLTGSEWANHPGPRLAVPARVLLIMAKTLLGLLILAYVSLARNSAGAVDADVYAQLGDLILGTALIAAAFGVLLRSVSAEQAEHEPELEPEPEQEPESESGSEAEGGTTSTPNPAAVGPPRSRVIAPVIDPD